MTCLRRGRSPTHESAEDSYKRQQCLLKCLHGAGPEHAVGSLEGVLGERMLQAWRLRAQALQNDKRYPRLSLLLSQQAFALCPACAPIFGMQLPMSIPLQSCYCCWTWCGDL